MQVVLTEPIEPGGMAVLRQAGLDIVEGPGGEQSPDQLRALCRGAHAVIVRQKLPDDLASTCPNLLVAARHGVGVDLIPVENCTANGVLVTNVPGANADAVAEFVVAQMLAAARRVETMSRVHLEEGWKPGRAIAGSATELRGRTLGIVGVGAIGTRLAEIAHHGFRMQVLGFQRRREALPPFVEYAALPELFSGSDYIALACPLTPETRGLASAALIRSMKPSAWLMNVSRGAVVEEEALVAALREGAIGGAALDVYAVQPLGAQHPLRKCPNAILSPHVAGLSRESAAKMSQVAAEEVVRVLRGERPLNLINPEAWEGRRRP
ncbi:hydroxyacid dehydrogenase [Siccirubricoccus sp. KC 17139]|uniref:Hydroxyacid dehydrogenase n=1 Tax=Siccirubricoccus soli TaxID=2899147 RepID=A0ABT1D4G8_9PROT|nr:hydroxyacid dehydrogenase [Siccirubricoccus soli]MCO6416806.1 hydroxyacid dehydrogenase [Siccirubricoccus soli]MCP2682941.1 hydroxyacid dehydrogenase [Siccirubricoccus soli]